MLKKIIKQFCIILALALGLLAFLITQPIFWPSQSKTPLVSPAALEVHVRTLSEKLHPRCYDYPEKLEAAATYIEQHFVAAGARVSVQNFFDDGNEYYNVSAEFGPSSGPVLIVGAHYDLYGENYQEAPLYTPGADDNASGTAALLALADLLSAHPPAKQVRLVAYSLEEPPFFRTERMGSAKDAAKIHADNAEILGMISLEMVGYFSDAPGSQAYPIKFMDLVYPKTGNFIAVVGRFQDMLLTRKVKAAMLGASDLPTYSINALPVLPGIDFSDHLSYWSYGYNAVMITDTAFYRNTAYHTETDTADRLDYQRMGKVVQGVFAAVMALTDSAP